MNLGRSLIRKIFSCYFSAGILMGKNTPHMKTPLLLSDNLHTKVFQKNWQRWGLHEGDFASGVRLGAQRQRLCWLSTHMTDVLAVAVVNPARRAVPRRAVCWFSNCISLENRKGSRYASNKLVPTSPNRAHRGCNMSESARVSVCFLCNCTAVLHNVFSFSSWVGATFRKVSAA